MISGSSSGAFVTEQFRKGQSCLLNVMDDHFLVRIAEVDEKSVRVSFPGRDYPVEGMRAYLEFHDESGFDCYPTHVVQGPDIVSGAIVLDRPQTGRRMRHRLSYRIPTDLTVQVKDQVHIRNYDAAVLNLSSGGALIQSEAPFDFSTTVEITLSLPGEPTYMAVGHVVHIARPDDAKSPDDTQLFGVRFVDPDPAIIRSLNRYLAQRLRDLYPD